LFLHAAVITPLIDLCFGGSIRRRIHIGVISVEELAKQRSIAYNETAGCDFIKIVSM